LVILAGPIGAGKSTVAELLARRLAQAGRTSAVADLDDVAFMQHGRLALDEFWGRGGLAHCALVRSWFAAGTDIVVAHGPFFESQTYEQLFASVPPNASALHVVLRVSYEQALSRVTSDPERGPGAISRDPSFLEATHEAFRTLKLPRVDIEIETTDLAVEDVVDEVLAKLSNAQPSPGLVLPARKS
jgi:deoxyadenosine/deoxycytidine kinase